MDKENIINKYNRILKNGVQNLLPLEKIIALEDCKELIIEKYLKKILRLDIIEGIIFPEQSDFEEFKNECIKMFGFINYYDKKLEDETLTIVYIFDLCEIMIRYNDSKVKYKITIYWDT